MSRKSGDVKGLSWPGWQRHRPIQADKICIDNLQISTDVFLDPFGRTKSQPALLSVTLFLRQQFQSAAKKDALDQSTVHYGSLSKNIRETIERKAGTDELRTVRQMWNLIIDMLLDETVVDAFEIDIFFPKACLTGDGIGFRKSMSRNGPGSFIIYFKNLRVSTLIGVNSHEREYKQPVIANVWLDDAEEEILVSTQLYVWQAQQSIVEVCPILFHAFQEADAHCDRQ